MAVVTHYFAGFFGVSDPNSVWFTDTNAFDSSDSTSASVYHPNNGSVSTNYLRNTEGTTATGSDPITQVRARVRASGEDLGGVANAAIYTESLGELLGTATRVGTTSATWGSYTTLSTPSGGWTWAKLALLETKVYATNMTSGDDGIYVHKVEIEVTTSDASSAIKTFDGLAYASTKTVDGLAVASVKTHGGLS